MLIDILLLQQEPLDFDETLPPGQLDLGPDLQQTSNLRGKGRAQLVEEHHGKHLKIQDIRLNGDLKVTLQMPCARCLEPVTQKIAHNFDLLYRPQGVETGREELSITDAEAEISYYEGEGLLLEDALREQVLLAAPLKAICREDCKGLCPHCGKNLNVEQCSCEDPVEEPRWAALKDIRSKLQN